MPIIYSTDDEYYYYETMRDLGSNIDDDYECMCMNPDCPFCNIYEDDYYEY